jgi:hypothetical protein
VSFGSILMPPPSTVRAMRRGGAVAIEIKSN